MTARWRVDALLVAPDMIATPHISSGRHVEHPNVEVHPSAFLRGIQQDSQLVLLMCSLWEDEMLRYVRYEASS